jgi:uncharacterized membrane protein YtjA (UPF0391 family)
VRNSKHFRNDLVIRLKPRLQTGLLIIVKNTRRIMLFCRCAGFQSPSKHRNASINFGSGIDALPTKENFMLYWAMVFFIISIVAALFGFGGIASASAGVAQTLFYVFLVFFVVTLVAGLAAGRRTLR